MQKESIVETHLGKIGGSVQTFCSSSSWSFNNFNFNKWISFKDCPNSLANVIRTSQLHVRRTGASVHQQFFARAKRLGSLTVVEIIDFLRRFQMEVQSSEFSCDSCWFYKHQHKPFRVSKFFEDWGGPFWLLEISWISKPPALWDFRAKTSMS